MTTSNIYSEYPDWEMAARKTYLDYCDRIAIKPVPPSEPQAAALDGGADTSDFYSEFERGWDGATQSMLDIFERALDNPVGGDVLKNITALLENFRQTYPKHGTRKLHAATRQTSADRANEGGGE